MFLGRCNKAMRRMDAVPSRGSSDRVLAFYMEGRPGVDEPPPTRVRCICTTNRELIPSLCVIIQKQFFMKTTWSTSYRSQQCCSCPPWVPTHCVTTFQFMPQTHEGYGQQHQQSKNVHLRPMQQREHPSWALQKTP